MFVKFFFKIFERLKFRLSERDGLQPCIPFHFVRLSRLYVLAFLTRFVGLAPLSSCAFIIAPIQLFVKGFSKLFLLGKWKVERAHENSSLPTLRNSVSVIPLTIIIIADSAENTSLNIC